MRPGVAPRSDSERERIAVREAGKDEARRLLRNMVAGKMPRGKFVRERMIAARTLLQEKAELSHTDDTADTLRTQQERFDGLMAAVRGDADSSDNSDGVTEPRGTVGEKD